LEWLWHGVSMNGEEAVKNLWKGTPGGKRINGRPRLTFWLREAPTSITFNNCTFCPHCIYVFCKQQLLPLTA
jgi:hypothetical protein